MKKWLLHIIYLGVLALITSCSSNLDEDTLTPPTNAEKVSVTFTLALGETSSYSSRAVENDDSGNSYENYIDVSGLQVIAYSIDGNNTYLGEVKNIMVIRDWDSTSGHIYEFIGDMDYTNDMELNCKFMVYANCGSKVTGTTNLSNFSFSYIPVEFQNQSKGIPMWGVLEVTNKALTPNSRTDLGTIYLLRAMAKVEVNMSVSSALKYKFSKVHINSYYKSGYCLPNGYASLKNTDAIDRKSAYNPYIVGQTFVGGADFFRTNDNSYYFYMPEYNNKDTQVPKIEIAVTDLQGNSITLNNSDIYFKDYSTEANFNVTRNFYYVFNVTISEEISGGNIKTDILSTVEPWRCSDVSSDYE